jgi:hypothetical protein
MKLYRWLAALFGILAFAGCGQVATGMGQAPPENTVEYPRDRGGDGGRVEGGGGM